MESRSLGFGVGVGNGNGNGNGDDTDMRWTRHLSRHRGARAPAHTQRRAALMQQATAVARRAWRPQRRERIRSSSTGAR